MSGMTGYRDKVHKLVQRFGPVCWPVIYHGEVRCRVEHFERTRRRGVKELADATAAGGTHPYDPNDPWKWVFSAVVKDTDYWKEEVEDHCLLVAAKARTVVSGLGEDAPVAGAPGSSSTGLLGGGQQQLRGPKRPAGGAQQQHLASPAKKAKVWAHNVADGLYTSNRRGGKLCNAFQVNSCANAWAQGGCTEGQHQCARCLSRDHGSSACSRDAPDPGKGKGKRRGKGKKKGE